MAHERIGQVIEALTQAGLTAQRGYPTGRMPHLQTPLATVNIKSAQGETLTLTVQIYMPMDRGCAGCEDTALEVARLLGDLGAECQVGQCSFGTKEGLFSLPVQAAFTQVTAQTQTAAPVVPGVEIDGVAVDEVLELSTGYSCSTAEGVDPSTDYPRMESEKRRWTVTVVDLVEAANSPVRPIVDGFSLTVIRPNVKELYVGCCWSKTASEQTEEGIRRTRVALTCNEPEVIELT